MLWIEQSPDDVIQRIERLQYFLATFSVEDWLFSIKY